MKCKKLSVLLAAACLTASLAACNAQMHVPDWENTLPTVTALKTEPIVISLEEPPPEPIPIEILPEYLTSTTVTTLEPPLATGANTDFEDDDDYSDLPPVGLQSLFSETTATAAATIPFPALSTSSATESESSLQTSQPIIQPEPQIDAPPSKERPFSYRNLSDSRKDIYDSVISAVLSQNPTLTLDVADSEYKAVYEQLYGEENALFYLGNKVSYINGETGKVFNLDYTYTKEEVLVMQAEIDAAVNEILGKIGESMTEYEKVKLFFDELSLQCVYDADERNASNIYGSLVRKRATCGGLSKAFDYLCGKAGIESLVITGEYDVPHMWNMVRIDSEWYHVDVTAGIVNNSSFKYVRYDYFCVTDEFIKRSRTVYPRDYSYPPAVHNTFNYFRLNGLTAYSYADAERILSEKTVVAASNKENVVQVAFSSRSVFDETVARLFGEQAEALNILAEAHPKAANKFILEPIEYNQDPQTLVIKIFLEYP